VFLQRLQLTFELLGYFVDFASDKAEVGALVAHKAENEIENWTSHITLRVVFQYQVLESVVEKGLFPK
jgi:hypothetical protein